MKKIQLIMVIATSILLSCSKNGNTLEDVKESNGITFEIAALENFKDGRPKVTNELHSQEAINNIQNVTIYAFKLNNNKYIFERKINIIGWIPGSSFKKKVLTDEESLKEGSYRFLGVGLNKDEDYTINGGDFDEMYAKALRKADGKELFSGITDPIDIKPGVSISIKLTRKVAGILGYFKNVPSFINNMKVAFLRLNISNSETSVNLIKGEPVGDLQGGYNIIDIDLSKQKIENDIFTGNSLSNYNIIKLPNSQLSGSFVMPVNKIKMTLSLCDEMGITIKEWKVFGDSNNNNTFDIKANHFYTLGKKYQKGSTNKDNAIDLSNIQSLNLIISSEWELIHDLDIE